PRIVLGSFTVAPSSALMPPPMPWSAVAKRAAWLSARVLLVMVSVPPAKIAPPIPALLSVRVLLVMVTVPPAEMAPPPPKGALLRARVLFLIVSVQYWFQPHSNAMPPSVSPKLSDKVLPMIVTGPMLLLLIAPPGLSGPAKLPVR